MNARFFTLANTAARRKTLLRGLKFAVAVAVLAMLYAEFQARRADWPAIGQAFLRQLRQANAAWLLAALLLVPFNWLAETKKWHQFVRRYEAMSTWRAMRAVLTGVSFSLFTPNRVGEYGGRLLYVQPRNRWKALIANLVGNFSQYMVLLTGGAIGAVYFLPQLAPVDPLYGQAFGALVLSGLVVLYAVYFNLPLALPVLRRLPMARFFRRWAREVQVITTFNRDELGSILGWAILRYAVYSTQYLLLLKFFGIEVATGAAYAAIATIFLVQTSLPLPPIAGLAARGDLAIQVWAGFGANPASGLAATFTLWIINLILPALIGTFSLLHVNITKQTGYDDDQNYH